MASGCLTIVYWSYYCHRFCGSCCGSERQAVKYLSAASGWSLACPAWSSSKYCDLLMSGSEARFRRHASSPNATQSSICSRLFWCSGTLSGGLASRSRVEVWGLASLFACPGLCPEVSQATWCCWTFALSAARDLATSSWFAAKFGFMRARLSC